MTEIDEQLGRIFDYLKATNQYDSTLIVFTSDHGEQLGDHYLFGKLGYLMLPITFHSSFGIQRDNCRK